MARARNIKPSFFKNETLVELPFEHRLLFVGLWTLADRDGKLEDRPKRIKMEVFPADDVNVEAGLSLLEESGFIERYEADGVKVIVINNFAKHQSPHHTEKASELPNKDGSFTVNPRKQNGGNPPDSLNPDSLNPDSPHSPPKGAPPPSDPKRTRKTSLPDGFDISEPVRAWAERNGYGQLQARLDHFIGYVKANGKTYANWDQALMNAIRDDWAKLGAPAIAKSGTGWWIPAGFPDQFQAENAGCTERSAHSWRDGKRLETA